MYQVDPQQVTAWKTSKDEILRPSQENLERAREMMLQASQAPDLHPAALPTGAASFEVLRVVTADGLVTHLVQPEAADAVDHRGKHYDFDFTPELSNPGFAITPCHRQHFWFFSPSSVRPSFCADPSRSVAGFKRNRVEEP
jgi:hypothetical protein